MTTNTTTTNGAGERMKRNLGIVAIGLIAGILFVAALSGTAVATDGVSINDGDVGEQLTENQTEESTVYSDTSVDTETQTISTHESSESWDGEPNVAVTTIPNGPSFNSEGTMTIFVGAFNDSEPRAGVEGELLNVSIRQPDGTFDNFTRTTDSDGTASVDYDLASKANGTYQVTVDNGIAEASISPEVGPIIEQAERSYEYIPVGEQSDIDFLVRNGEFGQAHEKVNITIQNQDGDLIKEEQIESDADGFATVSLTPEAMGSYEVKAEVANTKSTARFNHEAREIVFRHSLFGLRDGITGEQSSFGGYLLDSSGPVGNTEVIVEFRNDSEVIKANKTATTGDNGFFYVEYVTDGSDDLSVDIRKADGTKIVEHAWVPIEDPFAGDDGGAGETQNIKLSAESRNYDIEPGMNATFDIEATDNGSAIANQVVSVFARLDYDGAPIATRTVTTNQSGEAVVSIQTSERIDGVDITGQAAIDYKGKTTTDGLYTEIQQYDIDLDTPWGKQAGENINFTVRAKNTSSNKEGEGVPLQFNALDNGRDVDSYATGEIVTNATGVGSEAVTVPRSIEPYNAFTYATRYESAGGYYVNVFDLPGSAEIVGDSEVAPGEQITINFTTPDGTAASGLAFGEFEHTNDSYAEGNSITAISTSTDGTLTVPEWASDGTNIDAWAADGNGNFYTGEVWIEINESADGSGDEGGSGGDQIPIVNIENATASPGETARLPLKLSEAPNGLSGYKINVTIENKSIAEVTDATYPSAFNITSTPTIDAENNTIALRAADGADQIQAGDTDIHLATVDVTAQNPGLADVTINVSQMDPDGAGEEEINPETDPGDIRILGQPKANFTFTPDSPLVGENVTFNASKSSDPDGQIEAYQWDFDGDGATDKSGLNVNHSFDGPGTHLIKLTVTDDSGNSVTTEKEVSISAGQGDLVASPTEGYANWTSINFSLTNVTPADALNDVDRYMWDFSEETNATQNKETSHVFAEDGIITVNVQALNSEDQVLVEAETTVDIQRADGELIATPSTGLSNSTQIDFKLTNLSPGVSPAQYDWDFGDGQGDFTVGTENNSTNHVYKKPGNFTAFVRALNSQEQLLLNSTTEVVIQGPDVSVSVSPPTAEQRIQDGVYANVTVKNERPSGINNVSVALNASGDYYSTSDEFTTQSWNVDLNASETKTIEANLTDWVIEELQPEWYSQGRIQFHATVDKENEIAEKDETNNRDADQTVATFSDVETNVWTHYEGVVNESKEVIVWVDNDGSAATEENHTVLVEFGDGNSTRFEVEPLSRWESERKEFTHNYSDTGEYQINATVIDDPLYPDNNRSWDTTQIQEFQFDVDYVRTPYRVENGSQFQVWANYDTNTESEVNLTLELPSSGLELAKNVENNNATKTDQSSDWGGWESWTLNATEATDGADYQVNVTGEARNKQDRDFDTIEVTIPKVRISNQSVIQVPNGSDTGSGTLVVRNETTYDHEVSISVQAGAEGRTLEGLEYLFSYPYGCVEQTASPMLAALGTDQYYRPVTRNPSGGYDRTKVNKTIAKGMESLSTGQNAQHDNGAWSMWGSSPSGDGFYTMYAYFGSTSVRNDPVQSQNTLPEDTQNVTTSLSAIDFNDTIHWIREEQNNNTGEIQSDGYFLDDDPSMTGYALISISQAGPFDNSTAPLVEDVRVDAARYLVNSQEDNGAWQDSGDSDNAKTTGIAVWGLQTVKEAGIDNSTLTAEVNESIENGSEWLFQEQDDEGKWVERKNSYWNSQGSTSTATAYSLLALNKTGVSQENESMMNGLEYLVGVYEEDGSWGYTRSSAIAIRTLNELGQGLGLVDRTVTIEIEDDDRTITKTVELNETQDIIRFPLNESERLDLQNGSITKPVTVTAPGQGFATVAINNEQVVNREEYESTQQQNGNIQATSLDSGLSVFANGDSEDDPFSVSISTPGDFSTGENQTLSVTVTNNNETANLVNPIVEIPLTGSFNASKPLSASVTETDETPRVELRNSTLTSDEAIFVFGRNVPAGESRTYNVNITVQSPGDLSVVADSRPLYNTSLNVNASRTVTAKGVGTMNVQVIDSDGNLVPASNISVGGDQIANNVISRSLTEGSYKINASANGTTFPTLNVSLSAFEQENVTFVTPPDSLAEPALLARNDDSVSIPSGSISRVTSQPATAANKEKTKLSFNVSTTPGTNNTAYVTVNESVERAFRANDSRSISLKGSNGTVEIEAENKNETIFKVQTEGEMQITIAYVGSKLGDVDGDENIGSEDAGTIADKIAKGEKVNEYADVNGDGQVNVVDAMLIEQKVDDNRDDDYRRDNA